jgi:hypothetical protein
MDIHKFTQILEEQETIIFEKSLPKYSEEDLDKIKDFLKKKQPIKDKRLRELYLRLKDAGIFD